MNTRKRILLLVLWIIVIFVLTGYPSLKTPQIKKLHIDKVYHFAIFFVLGVLEYGVLATFLFFLFGIAIIFVAEFQQLLIPGRDFEIFDMAAGFVGLSISYFIIYMRQRIKNALSKT